MWDEARYIICVTIVLSTQSFARDYTKQHGLNTDFLLHEGGLPNPQSSPKNPGYNTQFPALKPINTLPSTTTHTTANPNTPGTTRSQSSGKRDYVAPQLPSTKPPQENKHNQQLAPKPVVPTPGSQTSGKRDYVAPQHPTTKPPTDNKNGQAIVANAPTATTRPQSSGKRDYVAPQLPTTKPTQDNKNNQPAAMGGKVKDLINFYDSKNTPAKPPSYSSILQGNNNKQASTTTLNTQTTKISSNPTPKPLSFSSVVSGNKNPNSPTIPTKPGTPQNPVLPSSIVNNNKNQASNTNNQSPTDTELQTLSEELLRKDVNNAAKYVTINYQEKTTSQSKDDKAPQPLLIVSSEAWNIPTIQKFLPLLDNYERDTLVNEYVTPQERNEENAFMDAVMSTTVIRHLMNFFKDKGYVTPDPRQQRDFLKQLWFNLYSRGRGKISSSGFEHVFVSELKNGEVSGLHNWIYFSKEETANRVNYLGYLKHVQMSDKGTVLKLHFNQQGVDKPVDSMFIGTSPELEIALYTLCFVTRHDTDCNLKLGTKDVGIRTHTFRYRSKNLIGSAFPQI